MTDTAVDKDEVSRTVVGRGPGYPYISLRKAIERAEAVRDANMARAAAKPIAFYKVWGYSGDSGGARQTMAALNHFGLLDYVGRGDAREVRLSDLARRIVLDKVPDSKDRATAIRESALSPAIHKKLFESYPPPLPPDVVIETFLTRDNDYNDQAAASLIAEWRGTLDYAGLTGPDSIPAQEDALSKEKPDIVVKAGDLVQWTSGGVDQFPAPKRVLGTQTHEGKEWAFVEGEKTGVPMAELSIVTAAPAGATAPPAMPQELQGRPTIKPGTRQEVFALDEGDVTLTFPEGLSPESYSDLESYLGLFLKKAKRRASKKDEDPA